MPVIIIVLHVPCLSNISAKPTFCDDQCEETQCGWDSGMHREAERSSAHLSITDSRNRPPGPCGSWTALACMLIMWWMMTGSARSQLIKPVYVYERVIKEMHDYFDSTCIILLHMSSTQGLAESNRLLLLQKYLSTFHIRTAIMDLDMFKTRIGQNYFHIKKPLFILLNDHEDTRYEFAHISTWITMAYPVWMIFFKNETKLADFFFEIHVPFDCTFMVVQSSANEIDREIITEIYQIDKGTELRTMQFGFWDAENGLQDIPPYGSLYSRRYDLFGHNIRVISIDDPPVSSFERDKWNQITKINGFFGDMIVLLQEKMNCTFTYKEAKTWGMCLSNGTCTGAVRMLINGEADLAAAEFIMTSGRRNAIAFTTPIYTSRYRTYVKRSTWAKIKWDTYMAPFSLDIWIVIFFLIIIMSASIVFIQKLFTLHLRENNHLPKKFQEIIFFVLGAFCSQGMQQSILDPVRMVHFIIHITAVVILAAYSASLISFLTVKTFVMPFTTIKGLLKDNTYHFGVINDSADYYFFQNTSDKIMNMVFNKLVTKETNLPKNYLEGLERVCNQYKYAFMSLDRMEMLLQQRINCKLQPLDVISHTTIAMAAPFNSPYVGLIDKNILLLRDSGILQRLLETQWSAEMNSEQTKSSWKTVEIHDIMPLLLLIIIAVLFSYFVCIIEHIAFRFSQNYAARKAKKLNNNVTFIT